MIELAFAYQFSYPDEADGITLPVTLSYGGQSLTDNAKVDPGAAVCLFKREHAEELGLNVEQGVPIVLGNLSGTLDAFGHESRCRRENWRFTALSTLPKTTACRATSSGGAVGCAISSWH